MSTTPSTLASAVVAGWKEYQEQLIVTLRTLTPEQLAIRAGSDLRPVGEIAAHIVEGRVSWLFGVLKEGDAEIASLAEWEAGTTRSVAEYTRALEATWKLVEDVLARWTPEELAESIILPWIGPKYPITRAWVIWHILEHDLHHGGEISHSLGSHGLAIELPPPPPKDL